MIQISLFPNFSEPLIEYTKLSHIIRNTACSNPLPVVKDQELIETKMGERISSLREIKLVKEEVMY